MRVRRLVDGVEADEGDNLTQSMISTQAFIAKMERDYNASDAKKNATSFHLANVEMSRDPSVQSAFGEGRNWRSDRPTPMVHELTQSMYLYFKKFGILPDGCKLVIVKGRYFYQEETMLPGLELLPRDAVRTKRYHGLRKGQQPNGMVGRGAGAQVIECGVHQLLLLQERADVLFTADVVEYFKKEQAEYQERHSNGSKRRGDYPPHDSLVDCTMRMPVRLVQFD